MHYAHSLEGEGQDEWEPLEAHLRLVAEGDGGFPGAEGFAGAFGAGQWGQVLGWWHDLGKYSADFQDYLNSSNGLEAHLETPDRVDHSTAGAQHANNLCGGSTGRILAYCLAGHHVGLPDATATGGGTSGLNDRLEKKIFSIAAAPPSVLNVPPPVIPQLDFGKMRADRSFRLAVFCRMLFSCLVDADYLATERFMKPERVVARERKLPTPAELLPILDEHLSELQSSADDTPVNHRRREVLQACREAANCEPGLFSLTVPTGGGKTLSSLAFALKHAAKHDLRRVIYAIPFTSIIEQNADRLREAFAAAPDVVLEHHSNLDAQKETRWGVEEGVTLPDKQNSSFGPEKETRWGRLAAENWDAPLIVTTNVQFYESLFANKPSRCRKLHRIARSVIILDEAQSLPVELLQPTLKMLEELCRNYGCTIVLCSATQPAVRHSDEFPIGLRNIHEIINDPPGLFATLKRVEVEQLGPMEDETLVKRLTEHEQVLCVVNTRRHAAKLFGLLHDTNADNVFHLSAQMCPAHRSEVLQRINACLAPENSKPCHVISTQLIEAGVDIDFPVVYRAMAGLDSITQAAGRCNREGRRECGQVFIFETDVAPTHQVKRAAQDTREIAELHPDLFSLKAIEAFFSLHYWQRKDEWDKHEIIRCFTSRNTGPHFQFREAAKDYRLIKDEQQPVIVPYGDDGRELVDKLKSLREPPGRDFARHLQRYVVGLYERQMRQLIENAVVTQYHEQFWVIENDEAYDPQLGVRLDVVGLNPGVLTV